MWFAAPSPTTNSGYDEVWRNASRRTGAIVHMILTLTARRATLFIVMGSLASGLGCSKDKAKTLSTVTALLDGDASCPFGGTKTVSGRDNGDGGEKANDGVLGKGEIDTTTTECFAAMLMSARVLPPGDPTCPTGGQLLERGRDDGQPGGQANDGILEPEEVDAQEPQCNPEVASIFPPADGTDGTGSIDLSGGNGGSGAAGNGGWLNIGGTSQSVPASAELHKTGAADVTFASPSTAADPGTNPLVVADGETVELVGYNMDGGSPPAAPHFRTGTGYEEPYQVYDANGDLVTGLYVQAGGELKVAQAAAANVTFASDVSVGGTLSVGTSAFTLHAHKLFVQAAGIIKAATLPTSATVVSLYLDGDDGGFYNFGSVQLYGDDGTATMPRQLNLCAVGDVYNLGIIDLHGGSSSTDQGRSGGFFIVWSVLGSIFNGGTVDSHGGSGVTFAGKGGLLRWKTGASGALCGHGEIVNTPGDVVISGNVVLDGGGASASNGGEGGTLNVTARGGKIRSAAAISLNGGRGEAGDGGSGGTLTMGSITLVDDATGFAPALDVQVSGDLSAKGGEGSTRGGPAGSIFISSDVSSAIDGSDFPRMFATPASLTSDVPARVMLLGYGAGVVASGGSGTQGGNGGSVNVGTGPCGGEGCSVVQVPSQWAFNDVEVTLTGGVGTTSSGGRGGRLSVHTGGADLTADVANEIAVAENHGVVTAAGGSSVGSQGGSGGSVGIGGGSGTAINTAPLMLAGTAGAAGQHGGSGGYLSMSAVLVQQSAAVDVKGGSSITRYAGDGGGAGGSVSLLGRYIDNSGNIAAAAGSPTDAVADGQLGGPGGFVFMSAANTLVNIGDIDVSGASTHSSSSYAGGGAGGAVDLIAGVALTNSGTLTAAGGSALSDADDVWGGAGGRVWLRGEGLHNDGHISVTAGEASTSGAAGNATGGAGGDVLIQGDDTAAIEAAGGAASAPTDQVGGGGGTIRVDGNASGCLAAPGGSAAVPGAPGTITVAGQFTGSC